MAQLVWVSLQEDTLEHNPHERGQYTGTGVLLIVKLKEHRPLRFHSGHDVKSVSLDRHKLGVTWNSQSSP